MANLSHLRLWRSGSHWALFATVMAIVVPLVAAAWLGASNSQHGAANAISPRAGAATDRQTFAHIGASIDYSSNSKQPIISANQALAIVAADGMRADVQETIHPVVRLASFTNALLGQTGPPPWGDPKFQDVLVWDVTYPDAPSLVRGGMHTGPPTPTTKVPPCDLHIIVDASTGVIIEGFQDCS